MQSQWSIVIRMLKIRCWTLIYRVWWCKKSNHSCRKCVETLRQDQNFQNMKSHVSVMLKEFCGEELWFDNWFLTSICVNYKQLIQTSLEILSFYQCLKFFELFCQIISKGLDYLGLVDVKKVSFYSDKCCIFPTNCYEDYLQSHVYQLSRTGIVFLVLKFLRVQFLLWELLRKKINIGLQLRVLWKRLWMLRKKI